jgi:hypothetical protein
MVRWLGFVLGETRSDIDRQEEIMRARSKKLSRRVGQHFGFRSAKVLVQRIHDSCLYAFGVMTLMGVCSGFFFNVALNVFPVYWRDAQRYGFGHINAVIATVVLIAVLMAGGGCLVFGGFYYERIPKD